MIDYTLVARKRAWVPEWVWRVFCFRNLAVHQPFRWALTVPCGRPRLVHVKT